MNRNKALALLFSFFCFWILPIGGAGAKSAPYYSIHGASYQTIERVERHIESLQEKGYEAVYERVEVPGQGNWYRIYIGRYDNKDAAQQAAENLKAGKLISGFRIRRVMLPAEMAITSSNKAVSPEGKLSDTSFPVIEPFPIPRKPTKARTENIAPRTDIQSDTAAQWSVAARQAGEGIAGQGRQPGSPPAVPVASSTGQNKTDLPARQEEESVLNVARSEFKAQRYDRALAMLQSILNQPSQPEKLRGQALRLAADCQYFLGLKGDSKFLLTAVDQYRTLLISYPDPAAGNDLVYYHLAKSSEKLSFLYESAGAWDRLISTYPNSEYLPEAMFKLGSLLSQTGKYNRAIERLLAYLKKNPTGEYAKAAHFLIGDCYHLLHKGEFAGQWYDEALKKWPFFHDIPAKTIMNMGNHYFTAGQFSSSLQIFSLYHNLFPADEFGKTSLFMMARNAEAMGQTAMALRLYSLFIEKYPQDSEAETCLLAIAALGVAKPGIKFPFQVLPIAAYQSPLNVFNSLLAKNPGGERVAALLLLKGDALVKQNLIREGFGAYQSLLSQFPRGKSSDEGRKKLKLQIRSLVNEGYEKGDYLAVADIYFQSQGKNLIPWDDFATAIKIGNSLLATGLYDEASEICGSLKKIYLDRERENVITLASAKIDIAKNRDDAAEEKLSVLLTVGGSKDQVLRNDIKITLADLYYYKKGLLAKANPLYAEVLLAGGEVQGAVYRNYGRSLQGAKVSDKAIVIYLKALKDYEQHPKRYPADILADIYGGLGDAYYDLKRYQEGIAAYRQALSHAGDENADVRKWLTYMIGKGSANLKDFVGAEKSFAQVKANAVGEFWPKVTDYVLDRSRLAGKAGYQNE